MEVITMESSAFKMLTEQIGWDMSEAERTRDALASTRSCSTTRISVFCFKSLPVPCNTTAAWECFPTSGWLLHGGRRDAIYQEQREGFQSGECGALYDPHSPKIQITKVFTIKHLWSWCKRKRVMNRTWHLFRRSCADSDPWHGMRTLLGTQAFRVEAVLAGTLRCGWCRQWQYSEVHIGQPLDRQSHRKWHI